MRTFLNKRLFFTLSFMFFVYGCGGGSGKDELPKDLRTPKENSAVVVRPNETTTPVSVAVENTEASVEDWLSLNYTASSPSLYSIELKNSEKPSLLDVKNQLSLPLYHDKKWYNSAKINFSALFPEKTTVKWGKKSVDQPLPVWVRKQSIELFSDLLKKTIACLNVAKNHESSHYAAPDLETVKQGNLYCDGKTAEELVNKINQIWLREAQVVKPLQVFRTFKKQTIAWDKAVLGENALFDKMNLLGIVCLRKEKTCVLCSTSND